MSPRHIEVVVTPLVTALVIMATLAGVQGQSPSVEVLQEVAVYPTLIVFNGKVATMDRNLAAHQAMAIRGDKVWRLGTNEQIRKLAGPGTEVIDLKGRTVVPGLIDVHTHPQLWAWWQYGGKADSLLEPAYAHGDDVEEVKKNLKKEVDSRIQKQGKEKWIIASVPARMGREVEMQSQTFQFDKRDFIQKMPSQFSRAELDRIAPETPVVIITGCCTSISNTKGKEVMTKAMGYEPANLARIPYDVVWGVILKGKTREAAEYLSLAMKDFVHYGVTTVATHGEVNTEVLKAAHLMDREKRMPQRLAWSHESGFYGSKDPEEYYRLLGDFAGDGSDFLWNVGVGWEPWNRLSLGCTSAKPIRDRQEPDSKAYLYATCIPDDSIQFRSQLAAVEAGLRLFDVHGNEDVTLDRALALAQKAVQSGSRTEEDIRRQGWNFDHNPLIRPDQIPLIKKYGFLLDFQGNRLAPSLYNTRTNYGTQYLPWVMPVKSLVDAGIPFSLGTDVPISQLSDDGEDFLNNLAAPFPYRNSVWPHIGVWVQKEVEVASGEYGKRNRQTVKISLGPEQRLDRISALRGMTTWAAKLLLREDRLGSLEPNKLADFIVIDKDYFTIPEPEIMNIRTLMTVLGGKVAYKDQAF